MRDEEEITLPVPPWAEMQKDVSDLKAYCHRICDQSISFQNKIPAIEKRIDRIIMFQAWFPTAAIVIALLYKLVISGK